MKRQKTREQAVFDAVEREQKRFASELHDTICQELAGVAMMLDVIHPRVGSDVAAEIRSVSEPIRRVTLVARKLALGLAPIAVERAGLAGALAPLKLDVETLKGPTVMVSEGVPIETDADRCIDSEQYAPRMPHRSPCPSSIVECGQTDCALLVAQFSRQGGPARTTRRRLQIYDHLSAMPGGAEVAFAEARRPRIQAIFALSRNSPTTN